MSPQDHPGRSGEDKPEGLSKYLKRMRTALRPRSSSKRQSVAPVEAAIASSSKAATPAATAPTAPPRQSTAAPEPADYSILQQVKARALFAKYGLTLEPGEWKSPTDLQLTRVTKPIRMRVRRTCHRCDTTFGPDKVCVNCQHPRCKRCPRFPPGRELPEGEPQPQPQPQHPPLPKNKLPELWARQRGVPGFTPHLRFTGNPAAPLAMASRSGGQDFVRKPIRQRVHRICHACGTAFAGGSKECATCKHPRCKRCPRTPIHEDRYPNGYPGDVDPPRLKPERTFKKSRRRVHYICHVCSTSYNEGAQSCGKCGQAKCAETIRIPPKKVKREPDPDILQRVETKIAALQIKE
ncbi:uncharacterized protein N7459_003009 [Penicillium hispanicum]|uniref:uncharacterized protein n=1 Tax=Penicillium hispanicum TaxID=1080232 RepID=UPI00253F97A1|nr:uncharacterized protein N7459_003009 [Penicillium hispanicum]KAJ5587244.1 hypothetical protein N7459_003009 [Penicillium hispanicum]